MKKDLQKTPISKILLFSFVTLLIFLIISNYVHYKNRHYLENTINHLITKSVRRQQILTSILKGTDYARVKILDILLDPQSSLTAGYEKEIQQQVLINDSDHRAYQKLVESQHEQELYNKVKEARRLNAEARSRILSLIAKGEYEKALEADRTVLRDRYDHFQTANTLLRDYVIRRDNLRITTATTQLKSINNFSTGTNVALLILLLALGVAIARTLRLIKAQNIKLTESEKTYRLFTEQTNEIIETCDENGNIIYANDSFKKKMGYTDEELAGLNLNDILLDPSQNLNKPRQDGKKVIPNVERTFIAKDGKSINLQGNILLNYRGNEFAGATAFFNDVTEKKQLEESLIASEKTFRSLFDLSPIPMWLLDGDSLNFILVNKAAIKAYGYTENEFYDMSLLDIRPAEESKVVEKEVRNWLEEHREADPFSAVGIRKSVHLTKAKELVDVEVYNTFIFLNNKKVILSIAFNVTERNRNEQRITRAVISTQEQERYEIGGELHDNVCQILAAAKMSLTLMKPSLPGDAVSLYERSKESIMLATEEIRNLSHRLAPAFYKNESSLEQAFESLIASFDLENQYTTSLYVDKDVHELHLTRDVQLNLYRILQEQLKNIIKYADGDTIEVDLLIHRDQLKMRIADNGKGFEKEKVASGIGLANMERRAQIFSGSFQIDSAPGQGCEVLVILPLKAIINP